jgi:GrpB-like predicted nucleotidyltransferase (UPF0157 family)
MLISQNDTVNDDLIVISAPLASAERIANAEIARMVRILHRSAEIEHIGSTAVPRLPAKPIIDLMVGTPDVQGFFYVREALAVELDYLEEGSRLVHAWLRWPRNGNRLFHVHVVCSDGPIWNARLAFRDALRESRALRQRYAALKHELYLKFPSNLGAYTQGKRAFVDEVLTSVGVASEPASSRSAT